MKRDFLIIGAVVILVLAVAGIFGYQWVTATAVANPVRITSTNDFSITSQQDVLNAATQMNGSSGSCGAWSGLVSGRSSPG